MPKNCPDDACSSNEDFTQGIILRGIGGFYTVLLENAQRITCKQRGKLRKKDGGLYPGDKVLITITDDQEGMLEQVLPRKNQLNRPKVANISKAFMVLSAKNPKPDWLLLDRMLVMAAYHNIEPSICFNKWDILTDEEQQEIQEILQTYKNAGFAVFYLSALKNDGLEILKDALKNQISVFTGPSGVGKSSLLNALAPVLDLTTGEISLRLRRGKHTTRHVEMMVLDDNILVADTPGFSLLDLPQNLEEEQLAKYYPEFAPLPYCRFEGCLHYKEPDCAVKDAVEQGIISHERYERYLRILQELRDREELYR